MTTANNSTFAKSKAKFEKLTEQGDQPVETKPKEVKKLSGSRLKQFENVQVDKNVQKMAEMNRKMDDGSKINIKTVQKDDKNTESSILPEPYVLSESEYESDDLVEPRKPKKRFDLVEPQKVNNQVTAPEKYTKAKINLEEKITADFFADRRFRKQDPLRQDAIDENEKDKDHKEL